MTDPDLTAAYRRAFTDTEDDAVRRMLHFVETLPPAQAVSVRRTRWVLPAGVAAAVAAVAITTVTIAANGPNPAGTVVTARAAPAPGTAASSAPPSLSPTMTLSSTASSIPPTIRSPRSTPPTGRTTHQAAMAEVSPPAVPSPTPAASHAVTVPPAPTGSPVSSHASSSAGRASTVSTTVAGIATEAVSTYPTLGDPGITGPLTPYANAAAYTKTPVGLAVRANADDILSPNGVAVQFSMYVTTPSADPKVVVGGYLVRIAAPSAQYQSTDGGGPSPTPAGAALHLGDRMWRWNADHTLLISTNTDADIYIGVLATRAMNEFEPTIPSGYTAADIELIAAGLHT